MQFLNIDGEATLMDLYPNDEEGCNKSNTSDVDYHLWETESVEVNLHDSDINSYELQDNNVKVKNADIVNGDTNFIADISKNDVDIIVDNADDPDNSLDANIDIVINENTNVVYVDANIDVDMDRNDHEESNNTGQINAEMNVGNDNQNESSTEEKSWRMRYEISSSFDGSYWNNHAVATIIEEREREILSANVLSWRPQATP